MSSVGCEDAEVADVPERMDEVVEMGDPGVDEAGELLDDAAGFLFSVVILYVFQV